jgi:hypothetical protein
MDIYYVLLYNGITSAQAQQAHARKHVRSRAYRYWTACVFTLYTTRRWCPPAPRQVISHILPKRRSPSSCCERRGEEDDFEGGREAKVSSPAPSSHSSRFRYLSCCLEVLDLPHFPQKSVWRFETISSLTIERVRGFAGS